MSKKKKTNMPFTKEEFMEREEPLVLLAAFNPEKQDIDYEIIKYDPKTYKKDVAGYKEKHKDCFVMEEINNKAAFLKRPHMVSVEFEVNHMDIRTYNSINSAIDRLERLQERRKSELLAMVLSIYPDTYKENMVDILYNQVWCILEKYAATNIDLYILKRYKYNFYNYKKK